jgi:uncharacterized repeat protein (TIGR03806 family)
VKVGASLLAWVALAACGGGGDGGDDDPGPEVCTIPAGDGPAVLGDGPMCTYLSSYRLFTDIPAMVPAAGVTPYALNTALFSDYTEKQRFIWVPPGQTIQWDDVESFELPVGAYIAKTFSYLDDRRQPAGPRHLLETRILVHRAAGWEGAAYVHDPETGDAVVTSAAKTIDASWIHDDGATLTNAYVVPSKNQCKNCHNEHDNVTTPIGPKARHINRDGQLEDMVARGVLVGAPADSTTWPKAPVFEDPTSGTVEERARAWLDIDCAHCHNPTGAARTSGLDLSVGQTEPFQYGVCKPPVAAGQGSGGRLWGIVPGMPDASILVYRIESTAADVKMPELGRNLVHAEGVAVVREWITGMTGTCDD